MVEANIWENHNIAANFPSNTSQYLAFYRYVYKDKDMAKVLLRLGNRTFQMPIHQKVKEGSKKYSNNAKIT